MRLLVLSGVPLLFVSLLGAVSQGPLELSLADEYLNTEILDLSDDGRRMLIFARGRLTVFDLLEKRKIASWKMLDWPETASFVGKGDGVYYRDFLAPPRVVTVEGTKPIKVCPQREYFRPIDDRFAIGFDWERENPPLLKISLEDCSTINEIDLGAGDRRYFGSPTLLSNTRRLAYSSRRRVISETEQLPDETALWVRDLANFEVVAIIENPKDWPFESYDVTPDGSQLVALARHWRSHKDENLYRLFVFDASTGAFVRSFDFPGDIFGPTVSPDGNLIAMGERQTELREGKKHIRIGVKLLDFHTGQVLAKGSFPWRKEPGIRRKISWGGNGLQYVNFSPDGRKLFTTSEDTRIWDIPENLIRLTASQATPADPSPPPSTAGSPAPQQPSAPPTEEEEIPEGDQCYVYAIDSERARELLKDFAKFEALPEEEQKAIASQVEKHFEPFSPEIAEEQLTTKHYSLPFAEGKITASVYYTDENTAVKVGDRSAVLETMMLCVVLGEGEQANACEAEGGAVAETAAGYALKNRVMTRAELNGRKYVVGMVCERPSLIESMMNKAPDAP